jgi:four helix bundle protein
MFRFGKLDVWHKAIELTDAIYSMTSEFPQGERFGLTSQMRRAAVSVASNIAEGSSRVSTTDFLRFIEIAYGSLMELVTQCLIAKRQGFLSQQSYDQARLESEQLARMLSGLRASLSTKVKRGGTSRSDS